MFMLIWVVLAENNLASQIDVLPQAKITIGHEEF